MKTYNVMDGEPHLGKVIEETHTFCKADIVEALVVLFENDAITSLTKEIELGEGFNVRVSAYLNRNDLIQLKGISDLHANHGTPESAREDFESWFEHHVEDNATEEFETQEYA